MISAATVPHTGSLSRKLRTGSWSKADLNLRDPSSVGRIFIGFGAFRHGRRLSKSSLSEQYRRIMDCSKLPLTIEGHADVSGFASATKKCGQFIARGIETRIHEAESRGLGGLNPVRSASQSGFCAALRRPAESRYRSHDVPRTARALHSRLRRFFQSSLC